MYQRPLTGAPGVRPLVGAPRCLPYRKPSQPKRVRPRLVLFAHLQIGDMFIVDDSVGEVLCEKITPHRFIEIERNGGMPVINRPRIGCGHVYI